MSFNYTTGLNNMGSYQVSGRPWMKTVAFTGVQSIFYEFPNVTDYIKVMNDVNADTANLDIVFCEPRRGLRMANAGTNPNVNYATTGLSLVDFSISLWIRIVDLEVSKFFEIATSAGSAFRFQIHQTSGTPQTRFFVDGIADIKNGTLPFTAGEYYNIVATFSSGDSSLYINGELHQSNTRAYTSPAVSLTLGAIGATGFDGVYEQVLLFNKALTKSEVNSVYTAYESISNLNQSAQDSIVARYEFEDNTYKNFFPVADTTATIQDRASGFNLSRSGTATEAFVDGRALVNALSHHKITLIDQQEITLNCKAKQIFLRSTATVDVSICAGLTAIPAERMYELTGPGIDE